MNFNDQKILPAARNIKDLEKLMETSYQYIVLLNSHIAQLRSMVQLATRSQKKIILHADLIQGLKNDEYAAQFLCYDIKPAGLISTRKSVIITAKKSKIIAIQRLFLLDSIALESSYKLLEQTKPDFIEVLPGVVPHMISEVYQETNIPVIASGLIRESYEIEKALEAGAVAVSTSRKNLWEKFS